MNTVGLLGLVGLGLGCALGCGGQAEQSEEISADWGIGGVAAEPSASPQAPELVETAALATPQPPTDAAPKPACPAPHADPVWGQSTSDAARAAANHLADLLAVGCLEGKSSKELSETVALLGGGAPDGDALQDLWMVRQEGEADLFVGGGLGGRPWVALFQHDDAGVTPLVVIDNSGLGSALAPELDPAMFPDTNELMVLGVEAVRFKGDRTPTLVVVNTHPWVSSCWRDVRIGVYAAGGQLTQPRTRFEQKVGSYWCDPVTIKANGDELQIHYSGGFRGPMLSYGMSRARSIRLALDASTHSLVPQFAWSPEPAADVEHHDVAIGAHTAGFIDEWLGQPWSIAQQAATAESRIKLASQHALLHRALSRKSPGTDYTLEVVESEAKGAERHRTATVRCVTYEETASCPSGSKPVTIELVRQNGYWLIESAT